MRTSRRTTSSRHAGRHRGTALAASALLVVTLGLAACGSDDDGDGAAATPGTDASTSATLPPGEKAAGEPVKIGFISAEGGPAVSLPEIREAAEATATYANDYLGGIGGRPIELVSCKSGEDPGSATTCANEMVDEGVTAVVVGTTGYGDTIVPIVTGAGIPYVTVSGNGVAEGRTDGSFSWTGGFPSVLAAMAQYAKDQGLGSVTLFVTDVPAAVAGAQGLGSQLFGKAGVDLNVVPIPRGAPDVTSEVTSAFGENPAGVGLVGDATHCTSVLKALQTVGSDVPTMVIQPCISQAVDDAVPGVLNGTINFGASDIYSDDPETELYLTVMAQFAPDTSPEGYAVTGYQSLLGLVRATADLTGDVTPASVTAAIKASKDVVLPAGHGLTFTCDGTAIPILPSLCSAGAVSMTIEDLKGTDIREIDASALFAS